MTAPKWLDPKVTLGNIVTIVRVLIALAVGYTKLTATVDRIASELREHKQQQSVEASEFVRKDVLDTRNRFIDERLDDLQPDFRLKVLELLARCTEAGIRNPLWRRIGEMGERLRLVWGGRWKQRDTGHFEMPGEQDA